MAYNIFIFILFYSTAVVPCIGMCIKWYSRPGKLEYRYRCMFIIYVLFQTAFNCLKMIFENMQSAFRTCNGLNINNGMKKKTQKANEVL